MLSNVLLVIAGALIASAYFLLKNRRKTPYLELDLDALPAALKLPGFMTV